MEKSRQLNITKKTLDLREWWKQIEQKDIERIINKKDKWNYWWFNKDKTWITTMKNWKVSNYKVNEVEILFNEKNEKVPEVTQETKSEVLMDLFLTPDNQVKCTAEAYEKARFSNKTMFWFISKGKDKAVIVLDFSEWKKPKRTIYPLDKYNLKMKPVKV